MYTHVANSMREIEDFVNDNGIQKDDIIDIFLSKEKEYVLVYYGR